MTFSFCKTVLLEFCVQVGLLNKSCCMIPVHQFNYHGTGNEFNQKYLGDLMLMLGVQLLSSCICPL